MYRICYGWLASVECKRDGMDMVGVSVGFTGNCVCFNLLGYYEYLLWALEKKDLIATYFMVD